MLNAVQIIGRTVLLFISALLLTLEEILIREGVILMIFDLPDGIVGLVLLVFDRNVDVKLVKGGIVGLRRLLVIIEYHLLPPFVVLIILFNYFIYALAQVFPVIHLQLK